MTDVGMQVVIVTGSYPPQKCGIGDYTECLARALVAENVDISIITTHDCNRAPHPSIRYEMKDWRLSSWKQAVEWLARQKYDLAHFQYPGKHYGHRADLAFLAFMLKRRLPHLPLVVTLHEFRITHLLRKLSIAAITQPADAVLFTTESERTYCERLLPWIRNRIHVIPVAPAIPVVSPEQDAVGLRAAYGIRSGETLVAHFGIAQPNKGIERLLRAFALLVKQYTGIRLMMICMFEPASNAYHAQLQKLVQSQGLDKYVVWTGFLPAADVSSRLAVADVGVFPFTDGVSLRRTSFMSALSHGLPSVTTLGQTAVQKLGLVDGENVLLVPARGTDDQLAEAMARLIDSEELRAHLSAAGRVWASRFRWDHIARETLAVYRSVAG